MKNNSKIAFAITRIKNTSNNPCCTKKLIEKDGKLISQPFYGICDGEAEVVRFPSLEAFGNFIRSNLRNNICDTMFVSGMPDNYQFLGKKLKIKNLRRASGDEISLGKKNFSYYPIPTLMLLDYDPPKSEENTHFHEQIMSGGLIPLLHRIAPELSLINADHIEKATTSAGIRITNEQGNTHPYKPRDGRHIYFLVSDGTKIESLMKYIESACILKKQFWIEPNAVGRGMIKTPVDIAPSKAWTPRIIIPANITREAGSSIIIKQDIKDFEPQFILGNLAMLDLAEFVDHTEEEISRCNEIKKEALAKYNNQSSVIEDIKKHKVNLNKRYKHSEISNLQLGRSIDALVDRNTVCGDFLLFFDEKEEPVTARTLASAKGEEFDDMTLHDPLDPSPKNKNKARFFFNGGKNPLIHSLKHGGYNLLVRQEETLSSNERMNRQHAQVLLGGKLLYAVDKLDIGAVQELDERVAFLSSADLKKMYLGQNAYDEVGQVISDTKKDKPISMVDYWLCWDKRNRFNSVGFEPVPGLLERNYEPFPFDAAFLNTYKGLPINPVKGDIAPLLDYILNIIASGDSTLGEYITNWIASMVQKPNQPGQTVLVIKSIEGTGKTLFFSQTIGRFFGTAFLETADGEQVFGKFNGAASEAVFINLNEATWGGDKVAEGRMKQLATDGRITVEKKFQDSRQAANFAHLVITSNNSWSVGVGDSDRRYVIFDMSKKMPKDYYTSYANWLKNGGLEAALHYFLNEVDISGFDPRDMPKTADADSRLKLDQKLKSTDNMIKFMVELLSTKRFLISYINTSSYSVESGIQFKDGLYSVGWVSTKNGRDATLTIEKGSLYEAFEKFCLRQKSGLPPSKNSFGRFLKGSIPGESGELFAIETQEFGLMYDGGKRWRISWQGGVNALNRKLQTNLIGELVDIADVIDIESGLATQNGHKAD